MTELGAQRTAYSDNVEQRPSRFTGTPIYSEWAARADAWAARRARFAAYLKSELEHSEVM